MSSKSPSMISHLFVYGTLQPGDVRWHHLAPFVAGDGWPDTAAGSVFDTGVGYPAALFDASGTVRGRTYPLLSASLEECLAVLDEVEGVVDGQYRRIEITTGSGTPAWAYQYGSGLELTLIESGDWLHR